LQAIENGIAALQAGDLRRGEAMLRQGLASPSVPGDVAAVGYMWLATTSPSINFQIQCYEAATAADPRNAEAQNRLTALIEQQRAEQRRSTQDIPIPPSPTDTGTLRRRMPTPPASTPGSTARAQSVGGERNIPRLWEFGIHGGPNGVGSAFLVVRDGLLATARYVVGNATEVTVETRGGQRVQGEVVRSYPEYDLAFIRTDQSVPYLRDITPSSVVAPETGLVADDYTENTVTGKCRSTRRKITPGWFPTTFPDSLPRSFNGAPLIDDKDDLVGMLTRNADRNSGNLYGLHMTTIRRKIEEYYAEMQTDPDRMYCGTCGSLSAAAADGLPYCETCGGVFPHARSMRRRPHPDRHLYYPTDMK
ncbi:MAG: serine protease, partial [Chloroflexota bacterium]